MKWILVFFLMFSLASPAKVTKEGQPVPPAIQPWELHLDIPTCRQHLGSFDGVQVATLLPGLAPAKEASLDAALLDMLGQPGLGHLEIKSSPSNADFPGSLRLSGTPEALTALRELWRSRFPEAMKGDVIRNGFLELGAEHLRKPSTKASGPNQCFNMWPTSTHSGQSEIKAFVDEKNPAALSIDLSSEIPKTQEWEPYNKIFGGPAVTFEGLALLPASHTPALGTSRSPQELLSMISAINPETLEVVSGLGRVASELGTGGLLASLAPALGNETILAFRPDLFGSPLTPLILVKVKDQALAHQALAGLAATKTAIADYGTHQEGGSTIHYLAPKKGLPLRPSFLLHKGYLAMAMAPEHLLSFLREESLGSLPAWKNAGGAPRGSLVFISRSDRLAALLRATRPHQAAALIGAWEKTTGKTLVKEPDPFNLSDLRSGDPLGVASFRMDEDNTFRALFILPTAAPLLAPFILDGAPSANGGVAPLPLVVACGIFAGIATPAVVRARAAAKATEIPPEGR